MIKKKILPMLLAAAFIFFMVPTAAYAASERVYDVKTPEELSAALDPLQGGGTIRLTADIDYNTGITVAGKAITFDLNGHTLNVLNRKGHVLEVGSGGVVDITGSGELNITSGADYESVKKESYYGVYSHDGGQAKITSATGTGMSATAAFADGAGSRIEVTGDVKGFDVGSYSNDGGHIVVGGNIKAGNSAAYSDGSGSLIEVAGNAASTETMGVFAANGGTVRITGDIEAAQGRGIVCGGGTILVGGSVTGGRYGIFVEPDGAGTGVTIDGIVRVGGSVTGGRHGVFVEPGGHTGVTIEGALTAPEYIVIGNVVYTNTDGAIGAGNDKGYLVFARGGNTVRVKINGTAVSPSGVYDVRTPEELSAALGREDSVYTIRLTADIDYDTGVIIAGRSVTFDLNGYTLNVASSKGHGLEVGKGGVVDMKGNGVFNVTSNSASSSGVYACSGGQAKVTSASGTYGYGAYADTDGSIEVTGDVKGPEIGAFAQYGGYCFVGGNAEGGVEGVYTNGDGSLIEVAGNVTATNSLHSFGVIANGGTVRVTGNVSGNECGVKCWSGTVWIGGSLTAGETAGGIGVVASGRSDVTVDGTITAEPMYIWVSAEKKLSDGVQGTGYNTGYLVYNKGESIVRVKIKNDENAAYNAYLKFSLTLIVIIAQRII